MVDLTNNSKVPSGKTWTVSRDTTGAWLRAYLTVDGTLNLDDSMIVESRLITVNGTLNAEAGTIVKVQGPSQYDYSVAVTSNGAFNASGTAQDPVIFTSYKDDSAGGDTNGGGASSGARNDYQLALKVSGGTATVSHGIFRYSQTSFSATNSATATIADSEFSESYYGVGLSGSATQAMVQNLTIDEVDSPFLITNAQANIASTDISNAVTGLDVRQDAKVTFRGSFSDISERAIKACAWDDDCGVDAAYVDWGSADGPLPSGFDPLVCGKVTVAPWVYESNTYQGFLFASENCDSSDGPVTILGTRISYFQANMALKEIDCNGGSLDACNAMSTAMTCLGSAMNVAQSTAPWQLPAASTSEEIDAFSAAAVDGATNYVSSLEEVSVSQFNLGFFAQLAQVIDTVGEVGDAYNSCAP